MLKNWTIIAVSAILLAAQASGVAQKTTELYIPIGQSPGLSGQLSLIGKIVQVDALNKAMTVADAAGRYSVSIGPGTRIYLDKSKAGLPSSQGALTDCRIGEPVEVKFVGNDRSQPAEWIKVQKAR